MESGVNALRNWSRVKLKIIYIIMALIPLGVFFYFVVAEVHHAEQHEVEKNVEITKSNAGFIESLILDKVKEAGSLTQSHDLAELDTKHLEVTLKSFKTEESQDLFIASTEGRILASTRKTTFSQIPEFNKNQYFHRTLSNGSQVASRVRSVFTGEYVVTVYGPIYDSNHEVIGVVGSELPYSFFQKYLGSTKIGDTGSLSLFDQNGYYIYDKVMPDKNNLTLASWFEDVPFVERKSVREGVMTFYSGVRLEKLGWHMVGRQPSSEVTAAGLTILVKDTFVIFMSIIAAAAIWLYRTSLVNRNKLANRQNAEKLALVGELAAGMAHEIRNPLTTIRGFSQILKNTQAGENHIEIFELIMQSVDHIDQIVKETLLLAKPQQMKITSINLREILEDTISFMMNEAILQDVNLVRELNTQEFLVRGDPFHLKLLLINIIKNSLEATPQHGTVKIKLGPSSGHTAKIMISDTGKGIKPEIIQRIGTPFFTTKSAGTGLGLSVCKRITEEHGGTLTFNSKEGLGTTVVIELPVA